MSNFKIGEVVVGKDFISSTERNGMEAVILTGLDLLDTIDRHTRTPRTDYMHMVSWADGEMAGVRPKNLKRRDAPAGQKSITDMFNLPVVKAREIA